jgi:uncharacterized protein YkwD
MNYLCFSYFAHVTKTLAVALAIFSTPQTIAQESDQNRVITQTPTTSREMIEPLNHRTTIAKTEFLPNKTSRANQRKPIASQNPSRLQQIKGHTNLPANTNQIAQTILLDSSGSLAYGDEMMESDNSLFDTYSIQGEARQNISISLVSNDFDTYLLLVDEAGNVVAENDDIDQNTTNSQLNVSLPYGGNYLVIVNGYDQNSRGNYRVFAVTDQANRSQANGSQSYPPEISEILEAHNAYRAEVGVPNLTWSSSLANSAKAWADYLVDANIIEHSQTNGYGENIWAGTRSAYSLTDMVNYWGSEQRYFISNQPFPNLSTTGNWVDVGHYTQIVWRNTTEVGCGLSRSNNMDVFVCQYTPSGNFSGQRPF